MASTDTAFNKLPIELNKVIVEHLEEDKDIRTFQLICRATSHAIDGDRLSFWRKRFRETYALKRDVDNLTLKNLYQRRSVVMHKGLTISFNTSNPKTVLRVLHTLKGMINESYQGEKHGYDQDDRPQCLNQKQLKKYALESNLYHKFRRLASSETEPNVQVALSAIQLMCAHFLFDVNGDTYFKRDIFPFDLSQYMVYAESKHEPLYSGPSKDQVNMAWMLHCLNFFRNHMISEQTATLCHSFRDLEPGQRPSPWQQALQNGCYHLSKHWKGTYSFLEIEELEQLRELDPGEESVFMDKNVDEGNLQSLTLEFAKPGEETKWPRIFEHHLDSFRMGLHPRTRAQHRTAPKIAESVGIQFAGQGDDNDHFYARGWLNPLPAQPAGCEIPGWQRITFMKYFLDAANHIETDALWAYEGVVLPGGRIILGRWWYAEDPNGPSASMENSGPFIFWAVDPEPEDLIATEA